MSDAAPEEKTVTATAGPDQVATAVVQPAMMTVREVTHEEASDLPEISWGWRRVFVFAVTAALLWILWGIVDKSTDPTILKLVARGVIILIGLGMMLYVAGASSEAITRLVGAIKTTRKEVVRTGPAEPGETT